MESLTKSTMETVEDKNKFWSKLRSEWGLKAFTVIKRTLPTKLSKFSMERCSVKRVDSKFKHELVESYEFAKSENELRLFVFVDEHFREPVDIEGNPTGRNLIVYSLPYIKNYNDIYENKNLRPSGPYKVSRDDFQIMGSYDLDKLEFELSAVESSPTLFELEQMEMTNEESYPDANMNEMTMRDYVCIRHLYAGSDKPWLNKLINEINDRKSRKSGI